MKKVPAMIKVCGMTDGKNIREVEQTGIDWMGFIFYDKSPRYVKKKPAYLPVNAKRVGVFVNADIQEVLLQTKEYALDYVQLHGEESPHYCATLKDVGCHVIKAFSVASAEDVLATAEYEDTADFFLFDTKTPAYGGSGQSFDKSLLQYYHGQTPFFLSGGIGLHNIVEIMQFSHPLLAGYDLNSQFEIVPGIKDIDKILTFIEKLKTKQYEQNQSII